MICREIFTPVRVTMRHSANQVQPKSKQMHTVSRKQMEAHTKVSQDLDLIES